MTDDDKRRIEAQARAFFEKVFDDGDATEALAGLYAAAQAVERVLLERTHIDPRHLFHIQLVGKRIGVAMAVDLDIETIGAKEIQ